MRIDPKGPESVIEIEDDQLGQRSVCEGRWRGNCRRFGSSCAALGEFLDHGKGKGQNEKGKQALRVDKRDGWAGWPEGLLFAEGCCSAGWWRGVHGPLADNLQGYRQVGHFLATSVSFA